MLAVTSMLTIFQMKFVLLILPIFAHTASALQKRDAASGCPGKTHTIRSGDTCYDIAQQNGMSLEALNAANRGLNCNALQLNHVLCLGTTSPRPTSPKPASGCPGKTHTVRSGDTCYDIAQQNGMSLEALNAANRGLNCNALQLNHVLCLGTTSPIPTSPRPTSPKPTSPKPASGCPGKTHTVRRGDTCYDIAQQNGMSLEALNAANPGLKCDALQLNHELCLGTTSQERRDPEPSLANGKGEKCQGNAHEVTKGDTCYDIAQKQGITLEQLMAANSGLNCDTLQEGQQICLGQNATVTGSQPPASPRPTPAASVETGQNCSADNKYSIKKVDTCWGIAIEHSMTLEKFEALNAGIKCDVLREGQQVCVASPCKGAKLIADPGDSCWTIGNRTGIPVDELKRLNPDMDCTLLMPGQTMCLSAEPSPTVDPNPRIGHGFGDQSPVEDRPPDVDQPEILGNISASCVLFHDVAENDSCWLIRKTYGLTEEQFRALNPRVDCGTLDVGVQVCIGDNSTQPGARCGVTYTIKDDDTCDSICKMSKLSIQDLMKLNPNISCDSLNNGSQICLSRNNPFDKYATDEANADARKSVSQKLAAAKLLQAGQENDNEALSAALAKPEAVDVLKSIAQSDNTVRQMTADLETQRPVICGQLQGNSAYKKCICDPDKPFLHCQAIFANEMHIRAKRQAANDNNRSYQRPPPIKIVKKRQARGKGGKGNPQAAAATSLAMLATGQGDLQGFLSSICPPCFSSSLCFQQERCMPLMIVIELCIHAGICLPNPKDVALDGGYLTVNQFLESHINIGVGICITGLNEILSLVGLDACIIKADLTYHWMRQQFEIEGSLSLLVVKFSASLLVQVQGSLSENLYDTDTKKVYEDLCLEEAHQCESYCILKPGGLVATVKFEYWLFGWHTPWQKKLNDLPKCEVVPYTQPEPAPDATLQRLVVYTTSWAQYRAFDGLVDKKMVKRPPSCKSHAQTPKNLKPGIATHVCYAFLIIDSTTYQLKNFEKNDDELVGQLVGLKNENTKVLISIGGWSFCQGETSLGVDTKDIFPRMASSKANRKAFIDSVVAYVQAKGLDGVDIDWEYPRPEDRASFTALMQELRTALADYILTFAAPAGAKYYKNIDMLKVSENVDFINLMTYDFHGGSFETDMPPNVNAPIVDCSCPEIGDIELALQAYFDAKVPASKINMGLATYGRTFKLDGGGKSTGPADQGVCTLTPGVLAYYEIKDLVKSKPKIDNKLMSAIGEYGDKQWVGYDTKETLAMKMCYARYNSLGGVMVWDGEMDDKYELLQHISDNLNGDCDEFEAPRCDSKRKKRHFWPKPKPGDKDRNRGKDKNSDDDDDDECDDGDGGGGKGKGGKRRKRAPIRNSCTHCDTPLISYIDSTVATRCKNTPKNSQCNTRFQCVNSTFQPSVEYLTCGGGKGKAKWGKASCRALDQNCGSGNQPVVPIYDSALRVAPAYMVRYDRMDKLPMWSVYVEQSGNCTGRDVDFRRHDCWKFDQYDNSNYKPLTTMDRGHLTPNKGLCQSTAAMQSTFFYLNAAPQDAWTNQNPWRELEKRVLNSGAPENKPGIVVTKLCTQNSKQSGTNVPRCFCKLVCRKIPGPTGVDGETVAGFCHRNTFIRPTPQVNKTFVDAAQIARYDEVMTVLDQMDVIMWTGPSNAWAQAFPDLLRGVPAANAQRYPNPANCALSTNLTPPGETNRTFYLEYWNKIAMPNGKSMPRSIEENEDKVDQSWRNRPDPPDLDLDSDGDGIADIEPAGTPGTPTERPEHTHCGRKIRGPSV